PVVVGDGVVLEPHEADPAGVPALPAVDGRQALERAAQWRLVPPEEGRLRRHGPDQPTHLPHPELNLARQERLVLLPHPAFGETDQGQKGLQGSVAVLSGKALELGVPAGYALGESAPVGDPAFEVKQDAPQEAVPAKLPADAERVEARLAEPQ